LEEEKHINENTPLEEVKDPLLNERKISLLIKREDLNHRDLSGNKWHKLKYNLQEARKQGKNTLLTFGGAYSNHIYATAAAGKIFNLKTIGIIRGEEHLPLNPTLSFAKDNGMKLYYLDRTSYRKKTRRKSSISFKKNLVIFICCPRVEQMNLPLKVAVKS
jgi:1-aminocyclopropane-1-carboxylate deaminase